MKRITVESGDRYGRLSVVREVVNSKRRMIMFRCDCGNTVTLDLGNVRSGHTTSCGCNKHKPSSNRLQIQIGERYGRLVVSGESEPHHSSSGQRRRKIQCQCDCGNSCDIWLQHLKTGHTTSCGCLSSETRGNNNRTHGKRSSSTYSVWTDMKTRCHNESNTAWEWYGGRGITVCDRWLSFEAFLEDMGERPDGLTIDRIDTNGNYEPGNCRWATMKEQGRNKRTNNLLTCGDETRCITEWSEITGIPRSTIRNRLKAGWTVEKALRTVRRNDSSTHHHAD